MKAKQSKGKAKAAQAAQAAQAAKSNPYLQTLMHDDRVRMGIRDAYEAASDAYRRLSRDKDPSRALARDKKLHRDLKVAAEALHDATDALRRPKRRKSASGFVKLLLLATIGAIIAVVVSEDLRNKLLDKLFGAEEEFTYPSTEPITPPPTAETAATDGVGTEKK
jgi:hypothetical protein